jgi:hypothetical protein
MRLGSLYSPARPKDVQDDLAHQTWQMVTDYIQCLHSLLAPSSEHTFCIYTQDTRRRFPTPWATSCLSPFPRFLRALRDLVHWWPRSSRLQDQVQYQLPQLLALAVLSAQARRCQTIFVCIPYVRQWSFVGTTCESYMLAFLYRFGQARNTGFLRMARCALTIRAL